MEEATVVNDVKCFHCGESGSDVIWFDGKAFCCYGCQTVYEILNSNNLCTYYDLSESSGVQLKNIGDETYAYLDEPEISTKLLIFNSPAFAKISFFVPSIHCVSCIWLLENLQRLNSGVLRSEVNFTRKTVDIDFNPQVITPGRLARLLASLGYVPKITLEGHPAKKIDSPLLLKLTIAGFCFGNVMLFSFPEYLGIDHSERELIRIFSWLNLGLSIPVFFFSGMDYLRSAFKSFRQRQINIDVPIAAGLIALFSRSAYDILTGTGPGYLDSFTGLVFFLLIGRWFQSKTYETLAFDRDFTSYFPLAVNRLETDGWKPVIIYNLKRNDQIRIRNMELVPADSILLDELAYIDYSFVTGESKPVKVGQNETVYAGGRLIGTAVSLVVEKSTSQSHLTSLWNNDAFKKVGENKYQRIIDRTARKFTWIILIIAFAASLYWYVAEPSSMWLILTSVLMVACPCALALAVPFTQGTMMRELGKRKLYLKNADVIERMASIDAVVFDKTGTVTHGQDPDITCVGDLDEIDLSKIRLLTGYSTHPLSQLIHGSIKGTFNGSVKHFKEIPGQGIQAYIEGQLFKIGSADFVSFKEQLNPSPSYVFISLNSEVKGYFAIHTMIRPGIEEMIKCLGPKCRAMLSGDHETDEVQMRYLFGPTIRLLFNQSPQDKLEYIRGLQFNEQQVMMIGDGLNDAGALKQSDVGIAVTDNTGFFTPACDGILHGSEIKSLHKMLDLARSSSTILKAGFVLSFCYNAIALSFAVTGHLTPLVAAVLMPISSISVVLFSSLSVKFIAYHKLKNN